MLTAVVRMYILCNTEASWAAMQTHHILCIMVPHFKSNICDTVATSESMHGAVPLPLTAVSAWNGIHVQLHSK